MHRRSAFRSLLLASVAAALAGCGLSRSKPPTDAEIIQALKATHEKPAAPGYDGAVTVEVKSITLGQSRKWHYQDGGDATPNTDVWSARIHSLIRTHYRTRTMVFDWDKPYILFRNGLGEWQASITTGASKDRTYDEPPDLK